ncbi:unnamed protein product [Chrysodeixis includens]|uniref:Ricin B lectin domain-containing protein n=1 Tax=Chrysodeixis includens TaxID=689277 RepID=A0A9P0FYR1_CHRIL|nr:unnamed protein product [Chrysodeixis includens]
MVFFPVRKCYQAAKVLVLVVLVVTILALFEQWRGGKRNVRAAYSDPREAEYEREILEDEARIIPGLGEGGAAAHLIGEEKKLGEESEKKLAINVYLSDRIPYNRTLKDFRNPACKRVVYDAELPSASVILIFHNEPYSVVVRTIWSVVNSARRSQPWYRNANFLDRQTGRVMGTGYPGQDPNSPFVYLKEIILVDDNSTLPELKGKLSHYVRTRLPPDLIRILRLPDRVGLTRARLAGARYAAGDVIVFLDSHCESQPDWLRPLLQAVKDRPHAVVVPIIDVIESTNFYYSVLDATSFQVGGFSFMGHFTWTDVPEREKKRRGSDISPTWSPTMAGGLFAISRTYFWELGAYDEQMGGWGGENLEMSFRIWQCGGTLETIPCSRVGHVFRSFHPYGMPAYMDTHGINTARMAEVWMDEYAELFYLHRPDLRNNPKIGDVTHRKILREKLKCKSFQWYLDNIYKEKFVPVRDVYGYGRFKNEATAMCLDTLQREADASPLGVYPCHPELQATQYFSFSLAGELRDEFNCASVQPSRIQADTRSTDIVRPVVMTACHGNGREQKWRRLPTGQLQHAATRLCLDAQRDVADVRATVCKPDVATQYWSIDYTEDNNFHASDLRFGPEREQRLNRLRGQRRISRSLLSYPEAGGNLLEDTRRDNADNGTIRRHTHKHQGGRHRKRHGHKRSRGSKKRTKNKFILKIMRTLMNGTDEHLEVDIHCKHRQLFPNNSFVRDLVTILNEKNVKVINNGRVFERNKVTELDTHRAQKVLHKMDIEELAPEQPLAPVAAQMREGGYSQKQMLQQLKQRMKKSKLSPEMNVISREPLGVGMAQPDAGPALGNLGNSLRIPSPHHGAQRDVDKKIIIEDFVEVTRTASTQPPSGASGKHARKRKRKRQRAPAPAPPAAPPALPPTAMPQGGRAALREGPEDRSAVESGEVGKAEGESDEQPLVEDSMDRSAARDDWPSDTAGEFRFRRNNRGRSVRRQSSRERDAEHNTSERRRHRTSDRRDRQDRRHASERDSDSDRERARRPASDTDVEYTRDDQLTAFQPLYSASGNASGEASPVKVVMRSNLTFNLGDEFFSWKNRATDDIVNEFLGELSIPTNSSERSYEPHTGARGGGAGAGGAGGGAGGAGPSEPRLSQDDSGARSSQHHSSSSSDSSGD